MAKTMELRLEKRGGVWFTVGERDDRPAGELGCEECGIQHGGKYQVLSYFTLLHGFPGEWSLCRSCARIVLGRERSSMVLI